VGGWEIWVIVYEEGWIVKRVASVVRMVVMVCGSLVHCK
jgi:hypothetical protein